VLVDLAEYPMRGLERLVLGADRLVEKAGGHGRRSRRAATGVEVEHVHEFRMR
jgi:hypothetical protein